MSATFTDSSTTPTRTVPVSQKELTSAHMVGIGGLSIAHAPQLLRTVLGSCAGIVIFDPQIQVAGLAHSILPEGTEEASALGKFACQAVDNLIVKLIAKGADKKRLRAKLIGGAAMFGNRNDNLGKRNTDAARHRLQCHEVAVVAEAIGGTKGRKLLLYPSTGKVLVEVIGEQPEVL